MVPRSFCQAHLQEVGLTIIPGDHDFFSFFFLFHYDEFQDKLQGKCDIRFQVDYTTNKHCQVILAN